MRIVIDGDAMPSIELIEGIANIYSLESYIFCDFTHNMNSDYSKIITVSKGYQSVDMKIIAFIQERDFVITNDYGLASLCLAKNCYVVDSKGLQYTDQNIDILLQNRYLNLKSRHRKGPKKRTNLDDKNLIKTVEQIIQYDIMKE